MLLPDVVFPKLPVVLLYSAITVQWQSLALKWVPGAQGIFTQPLYSTNCSKKSGSSGTGFLSHTTIDNRKIKHYMGVQMDHIQGCAFWVVMSVTMSS